MSQSVKLNRMCGEEKNKTHKYFILRLECICCPIRHLFRLYFEIYQHILPVLIVMPPTWSKKPKVFKILFSFFFFFFSFFLLKISSHFLLANELLLKLYTSNTIIIHMILPMLVPLKPSIIPSKLTTHTPFQLPPPLNNPSLSHYLHPSYYTFPFNPLIIPIFIRPSVRSLNPIILKLQCYYPSYFSFYSH